MKNLYVVFLTLFLFSAPCWAALTNGYVTVVKNASASCPSGGGTCPSYQNGSVFDTGTSSGPGNVGIGSTTPGQTLDVKGTVRATAFIAGTGSATLTGDSNGNVGINQATPAKTLDVNGTVKMIGLTIPGATTNYVLTASDSAGDATWSAATGGLWTTTNTNDMFEINGSTYGNVGVGTNNTTANRLVVLGNVSIGTVASASTNGLQVLGNVSIGTGTTSNNAFTVYNPSNSNVSIGTTAASSFLVSVGSTGQTIIDSSGNIGIGTAVVGAPLVVHGSGPLSFTTTGNIGVGTPSAGYALTIFGNVGIGTAGTNTAQGVTGTGGTSCLCKTFIQGICTSLGTCT